MALVVFAVVFSDSVFIILVLVSDVFVVIAWVVEVIVENVDLSVVSLVEVVCIEVFIVISLEDDVVLSMVVGLAEVTRLVFNAVVMLVVAVEVVKLFVV